MNCLCGKEYSASASQRSDRMTDLMSRRFPARSDLYHEPEEEQKQSVLRIFKHGVLFLCIGCVVLEWDHGASRSSKDHADTSYSFLDS